MLLKCIRDIAKPHWFEIIMLLKRSTGLSVAELAKELGMSYMGVKQHCIELEKRGYVDTWRRPKEIGRPEKAYRLTEKASEFFPDVGSELTLEILAALQASSGSNAAEKLLFGYFQKVGKNYITKLKGDTVEAKAQSLARLRDREGRLSIYENDESGMRLVEFHDPLRGVAKAFDTVHRMEEQMLERVLGRSVNREVHAASGLTRITFQIT